MEVSTRDRVLRMQLRRLRTRPMKCVPGLAVGLVDNLAPVLASAVLEVLWEEDGGGGEGGGGEGR